MKKIVTRNLLNKPTKQTYCWKWLAHHNSNVHKHHLLSSFLIYGLPGNYFSWTGWLEHLFTTLSAVHGVIVRHWTTMGATNWFGLLNFWWLCWVWLRWVCSNHCAISYRRGESREGASGMGEWSNRVVELGLLKVWRWWHLQICRPLGKALMTLLSWLKISWKWSLFVDGDFLAGWAR